MRIAWTFTLKGDCAYCGKPCTRSRTFAADSEAEAQEMADRSQERVGIWHRKCGLS